MRTIADAVQAAADSLLAAAREQQHAEPDHADFCALARAAEQVLDALYALNSNVGVQLAHYGKDSELRTDPGRALHPMLRQGRQSTHQPETGSFDCCSSRTSLARRCG